MIRSSGRRSRLGWLLGWVLLTAALFASAGRLPWRESASVVANAQLRWIALALLLNALILPLWAAEWVRLAPRRERAPFRTMFPVVAITSSTLNTIPLFAGEAAAVMLLVGRAGLSRAAALSVLVLDQLLVGIAKLAMIALAAILTPLPMSLRVGVVALTGAVVLGSAVMYWLAGRASVGSERSRISSALHDAATALDAVRDPSRRVAVLLLALGKKAVEVLAVVAVQQGFGTTLPWWSAIAVVAALGIGTMIPIAPANLGTYEATAFAVYRAAGLSPSDALALAVAQHLCALVPAVGIGYAILTADQFRPRRGERASMAPR